MFLDYFALGVLIFVFLGDRRRSPLWIRQLFVHINGGMLLLLLVDAVLLSQRLIHGQFLFHWSLALDALVLFWSCLYVYQSKRLRYYLTDWPKEIKT